MSRESTWKELETYNEHEQFYLTLHLARQDPAFFRQFLAGLDKEQLYHKN